MDAFLDLMAFPHAEVVVPSPPRHDFTLQLGSLAVGVEMTEYHTGATMASAHPRRAVEQQWEALRNSVMEAVNACSELRGVHGTFCFRELNLPSSRDSAAFVSQVITCAKEHVPSAPVSVSEFTEYPYLLKFLRELRLRPISCAMLWDWNHNTAWIGIDQTSFLECIRRKAKIKYDLSGLDQAWLLVVSGYRMSQAMGTNLVHYLPSIKDADNALRSSAFDRAFVFQYMFGIAYEWPGWRMIGRDHHAKRSPTRRVHSQR